MKMELVGWLVVRTGRGKRGRNLQVGTVKMHCFRASGHTYYSSCGLGRAGTAASSQQPWCGAPSKHSPPEHSPGPPPPQSELAERTAALSALEASAAAAAAQAEALREQLGAADGRLASANSRVAGLEAEAAAARAERGRLAEALAAEERRVKEQQVGVILGAGPERGVGGSEGQGGKAY